MYWWHVILEHWNGLLMLATDINRLSDTTLFWIPGVVALLMESTGYSVSGTKVDSVLTLSLKTGADHFGIGGVRKLSGTTSKIR